ncbi:MAG: hypothetical protein K8H90_05675, partial [Thermoanaerobaculia bacterium]|nr:hypothetical protein [Thermoanaerobaculia bacterium]
MDLALAWPSHDANTLGDLLERLGGMAEEDHAKLFSLIEDWAADPNTTDKAKATLRERIRRFALTRVGRRRVDDEATRGRARAIYAKLEPSDPAIRHGWLFEKQWVEESADELEEDDFDFNAREERIHALRIAALLDVWTLRGFDGVAALLAEGSAASTVGQYAALCVTDSAGRIEFLLRCLTFRGALEQKADACMLGFLWSVDVAARPALLRTVAERIDADQQVRLFKSSPFEKPTWLIVDEYDTEISTRYWKEVFPQWSRRHSDSDLNELVDRLLNVGRPRAAFHAAHMNWPRLETSRLKRLLTDVAIVGVEAHGTYRLDPHDISEALQALDGRAGVTVNDMARMEFRFVSALDRSKHGIPNLERQIGESPLLYVQVMALLWKRSDDGQDPPEWRIEDPERRSAVGSAMHRVLEQMKRIPGTDADSKSGTDALMDWLTQVRALAAQYGRAEITDQCLGQLLAKAPPESTSAWPSVPVCEA